MADGLIKSGPVKVEDSPRRIRVLLRQTYIFDTLAAKLVWEHPYYPQYYLPEDSLRNAELQPKSSGSADGYAVCDVVVGEQSPASSAAVIIRKGPLSGFVRLQFDAMDQWFEEDSPIYDHPMDPYKRVDIRHSSRKVRVEVGGVVVAESSWAQHLYETGLPVRYYLPRTAAKWECLRPTKTRTKCPYKGEAKYFDIVTKKQTMKDSVWYYDTTPLGVAEIQGMVRQLRSRRNWH